MTKRNYSVDFFREIAIMSVLIYHFYCVCGNPYQNHIFLNKLLGLGGELGVTLFFIISGFGICNSLIKMDNSGEKYTWFNFIKKRIIRIMPQYYGSLIILLLITPNSCYLNRQGLFDIVTHALFIHNWFSATHGSISSVLWTMGTIFQFYILSIFIFKFLKKYPWICYISSLFISISMKMLFYHILVPNMEIGDVGNFIYGKQIYTALDNFVVGMLLCVLLKKRETMQKSIARIGEIIFFLLTCMWLGTLDGNWVYGDKISGYIWHSLLAFLLMGLMYFVNYLNIEYNNFLGRIILWISKYQYGIYVWHYVVGSTLITYNATIQRISQSNFGLFCIVMGIICIIVGYLSTIVLENNNYIEQVFKLKEDLLGRRNF